MASVLTSTAGLRHPSFLSFLFLLFLPYSHLGWQTTVRPRKWIVSIMSDGRYLTPATRARWCIGAPPRCCHGPTDPGWSGIHQHICATHRPLCSATLPEGSHSQPGPAPTRLSCSSGAPTPWWAGLESTSYCRAAYLACKDNPPEVDYTLNLRDLLCIRPHLFATPPHHPPYDVT